MIVRTSPRAYHRTDRSRSQRSQGTKEQGIDFACPGRNDPVESRVFKSINSQYSFLEGLGYADEMAERQARQTWYLLFFRHGNRVRLELSLPTAVSDSGVVQHWAERIILDDIDLDEGLADVAIGGSPDIDVPVRRRGE